MAGKMINVIHLSPYPYHSGGIDTWLHGFLMSLPADVSVRIFCPTPDLQRDKKIFAPISRHQIIYTGRFNSLADSPRWVVQTLNALLKHVGRGEILLVLSVVPTMLAAVPFHLLRMRRNLLICSHRGVLIESSGKSYYARMLMPLLYLAEFVLLRFANKVIANGWDTQKLLWKYYRIRSDVIPNAIQPLRKNPANERELKALTHIKNLKASGRRIILHLGTLRKVKGIGLIIDAYACLTPAERLQSALVFVGKGSVEGFQSQADAAGVEASFLGEFSTVDAVLRLSDVVINISGGSGVSNSLLESLDAGRPIVAWDTLTFSQVVKDGDNGFLAKKDDVDSLASKLREALAVAGKLDAENIRKSVADFTWPKLMRRWLNVLGLATE